MHKTIAQKLFTLALALVVGLLLLASFTAKSKESDATLSFRITNTPMMERNTSRVFSWHVNTDVTSDAILFREHSTNNTLIQHNRLSILAHAKSVSYEAITHYRHDNADTNYITNFGLVADNPSNPDNAEIYESAISILPEIATIQYEPSVRASITPTDSCFYYQPELLKATANRFSTSLQAAWDTQKGDQNLIIAVLDSGLVPHNDIDRNRIKDTFSTRDFVSSVLQSADGNGRDNDPTDPGLAPAPDCRSSGYHGTHVTGTIGAKSNNNLGITGVNWRSQLLPIRVLGPIDGSTGDIIDAVNWISNIPNLKIMNMSFGLTEPSTCANSFSFEPGIINKALHRGILSFAAAGNSHADAGDYSPGNCTSSVTVAATNAYGKKAFYSNYGPEIDISAPGGELGRYGNKSFGVLSTVNNNRYEYKQGTSMATPITAGIASLVFSQNPNLTAPEVKNILMATATPFQNSSTNGLACNTEICGSGIVNAEKAVLHAADNIKPILFFPRQELHALKGSTISIPILLSKKMSEDLSFNVELSAGSSCVLFIPRYSLRLAADRLSYTLEITDSDTNCHTINLELQILSSTSGAQLITETGKHKMSVYTIDPNNLSNSSNLFFEQALWTYLYPKIGNSHSVYLSESGTYNLSTISDMNTEIVINNPQSTSAPLFDSRKEDAGDSNKHDYWLQYTIDRPQNLHFTVLERDSNGNGGIYAVAVTRQPNYRNSQVSYCQVKLGVESPACSTVVAGEANSNGQSVINYEKSSSAINLLFFLVIALITLFSIGLQSTKAVPYQNKIKHK